MNFKNTSFNEATRSTKSKKAMSDTMSSTNHRFKALLLAFTVVSSPLIAANQSLSEPMASSDYSSYDFAFFKQYTPQNALEMVERLPGFSYDGGLNERGFGGNAGNVLIDGARPTSKSGGLNAVLKRISAAQVMRIEITRGGVNSAKFGGQSTVANIIRDHSANSGAWALRTYRAPEGATTPALEAGINTQLLDWDTSIELRTGKKDDARRATNSDFDAIGGLTSVEHEKRLGSVKWNILNSEAPRDIGSGKLALTSRAALYRLKSDTARKIHTDTDASVDEHYQLNERTHRDIFEVGVDWRNTIDDWTWHVIGIGQYDDLLYTSYYNTEVIADEEFSNSDYAQDTVKSEFILRTTVGNTVISAWKPQFGVEIARNTLDSELIYVVDGEVSSLSNSDVIVEELRSEIFTSFAFEANENLRFDGGIKLELSKIDVVADEDNEQSFRFIKPRFSSTYKTDDDTRFTLEAEHRVGQLNFDDFAASSDASDDRTLSGNSDLVPDKTTALKATYDWNFSELGSFKLVAFHEWRSDIIEHVILANGDNGVGNAGDARVWGFVTDLNFPLDFILANGLLELNYQYNKSKFDDPIISGNRTISEHTPQWLTFKFRQDLVNYKLAWGGEYSGSYNETNYLVDEIEFVEGNKRLLCMLKQRNFSA